MSSAWIESSHWTGEAMSRDAAPRAMWDALIVLGSNIKRDSDGFRPVTYDDYDTFGMLAGEIRIIAAVILYEQNATSTVFVAAEDVVTQYRPGIYEDMIQAAYGSPQGRRRLRNEAQGVQDLRDGKYVLTEFRLPRADSRSHSLEESAGPS